jgi:hypothetical protein
VRNDQTQAAIGGTTGEAPCVTVVAACWWDEARKLASISTDGTPESISRGVGDGSDGPMRTDIDHGVFHPAELDRVQELLSPSCNSGWLATLAKTVTARN